MSGIVRVSRRDFLRYTGVGAGALVFGANVSSAGSLFLAVAKTVGKVYRHRFPLNNFVSIQLDGTVVIVSHRSEMGQGIRSSLAAVLADELGADWSRVRVEQADADASKFAVQNPFAVPGSTPVTTLDATPPFLIPEEGAQFTDSSRSMAAYFLPMRLFGAGIRLVLIRAAAKKLGGDVGDYETKEHKVRNKVSGRTLDFVDLLLLAKKVPLPTYQESLAALKQPKEWNFIGKKMPFVDAPDMVRGKAVYGADVDLPGMLTAMIERCPVANGEVKSFDDTAARKVPGVVDVVLVRLPMTVPAGGVGAGFLPHAGVAVVAKNSWAALQGRRKLKVEWDLGPNVAYDSNTFREKLEQATSQPGKTVRHRGSEDEVDAAFALPNRVVEASYYVPHLAQAPMEPPVAIALYKGGRWEIWAPSQGPQILQQYVGLAMLHPNPLEWLAWGEPDVFDLPAYEFVDNRSFREGLRRALGWDEAAELKFRRDLKKEIEEKVKVHVTLLGGGFGRKSKPDYAIEAAFLAKKFPGVPIRVQWTREDDIQFSYFQACSLQYLKAALDLDGHATAWLQRSAFPSFFATLFPPPDPRLPEAVRELFTQARALTHNGGEYPYLSAIERGQGLEDMPFDVPHLRLENCPADSHIRCGWMRSVSNIYHAFAIGSFADELAIAAGRDSKDYLLDLIGEGKVLDLKAEGVEHFDNNGFPVVPRGEPVKVMSSYPPDTRRLRAVVERAAQEAGWDEKVKRYKDTGRGLGIAAHRSFLSYVAMVIDVSVNDMNELTIHEVHAAIDCGVAVNPDRIVAQMEGGIVYGLSLALHGEITVKDGAVEQHNFDDYPVLRLYQTPKINIHIILHDLEKLPPDDPRTQPTGVGEPPVPPVAPALANAIVAAGGPRIRELPMWESWETNTGELPKVKVL